MRYAARSPDVTAVASNSGVNPFWISTTALNAVKNATPGIIGIIAATRAHNVHLIWGA